MKVCFADHSNPFFYVFLLSMFGEKHNPNTVIVCLWGRMLFSKEEKARLLQGELRLRIIPPQYPLLSVGTLAFQGDWNHDSCLPHISIHSCILKWRRPQSVYMWQTPRLNRKGHGTVTGDLEYGQAPAGPLSIDQACRYLFMWPEDCGWH